MSQMSFSDFEYAGKQADMPRVLPRRYGLGRALEWPTEADQAVLPEGRWRPKTLPAGNHAESPRFSGIVRDRFWPILLKKSAMVCASEK
jgi:hypothetical protein